MTEPIRVRVVLRRKQAEAKQWCCDLFGEPQESPKVVYNSSIAETIQNASLTELIKWPTKITTGWAYRYGYFYFTNEADATLFILKWDGKIVANKFGVATLG